MNRKKTTAELAVIATAMIAALGIDPASVTQCRNDDIDGLYVLPPLRSDDEHWYLGVAGTDCEYVDEPGIDVNVIRTSAVGTDLQPEIRSIRGLVKLLVQEGHLPAATRLRRYAVTRYSGQYTFEGIAVVDAVSRNAALAASRVLWPMTMVLLAERATRPLS